MQLRNILVSFLALALFVPLPAQADVIGRVVEQAGDVFFVRGGASALLQPGEDLAAAWSRVEGL